LGFFISSLVKERELAEYLLQHPFGDIDRALLTDEEALQIESVSDGSWVATVRTKTKAAINALVAVATIVFPRSRDAFLKKLEAEASLRGTEAKRSEVALARDKFELAKDQTEYALDLANRIGDRKTREVLRRRLRHAIYDLVSGDRDETEIRDVTRRMFPAGEADEDEDNGNG